MGTTSDIGNAVAETIRRQPAPRQFDYKELNRMVRRHKAALIRAQNSGDPRKVVVACRVAVIDFNAGLWPDNWPQWQDALQDALTKLVGWRYGLSVELRDLAGPQWTDITAITTEGSDDDADL